MKALAWLIVSMFSFNSAAFAERYLIDPTKADTLRCDDGSFKNVSYTLDGPSQQFVFSTSDGQTHSLTFANHEECRAKINMVKHAQIDDAHPWVQVDTSPLTFAFVDRPVTTPSVIEAQTQRQISSERHFK